MPTIDSADEARAVARLIQSGQLQGPAAANALQALRQFDAQYSQPAAASVGSPASGTPTAQQGQQQPPSFLDSLGHAVGVAGRAVANGVLGVPEVFANGTDAAINIGNDLLHGRNPVTNDQPVIGSSSQAFNDLLTKAGVPQPQNGAEQLESGVIGLMAGAKTPGELPQPKGMPTPITKPGQAPPVQPGQTAGQYFNSPVMQWLERGLSYLPGGGAIRRAVAQQNDALGTKVGTIVDNLRGNSGAEPEDVGTMLSGSLDKAAQRIKQAAGQPFEDIEAKIPAGIKVEAANTYSTLNDLTAVPQGGENLGSMLVSPKLQGMLTALKQDMRGASTILGPDGKPISIGNGLIPIDVLRAWKTRLGGMIDWTKFSSDPENGALKQVWKSLNSDIMQGAEMVNPALRPEIADANSQYQVAQAQLDVLHRVIDKAGGPEKIFTSLMSGTKDGASDIRAVVSQLSPADRQLLAAAQLRRMGLATPGAQGAAGDVFNASTFLTNWNRMHPDARAVLFGMLPDKYAASVTQLAKNAEALKSYAGILHNSSGTAPALIGAGDIGSMLTFLMTGHWHAAAALGSSVIGTKVLASALTNPKAVAWLARQTMPSALAGLKTAAGLSGAASALGSTAPGAQTPAAAGAPE